ncbi:MAG: hypothetical protein Q9203_005268 [Teloschistes exilis]
MDAHIRSTRPPSLGSDNEPPSYTRPTAGLGGHRSSRRKTSNQHTHPKPPLTPNAALQSTMPQSISNPLLASAPASPPTPAPSPTPHQRPAAAWHSPTEEMEDPILRDARLVLASATTEAKEAWLTTLVNGFDNQTLSYLHRLVSPRLKKDPFQALPDELCLKVPDLEFLHFTPALLTAPRSRSLSTSTIPKPSFELHQSQSDGGNS